MTKEVHSQGVHGGVDSTALKILATSNILINKSLTIKNKLFSHQPRNKYIFSLNINSIESNLGVKAFTTTVDEKVAVAKIEGATCYSA